MKRCSLLFLLILLFSSSLFSKQFDTYLTRFHPQTVPNKPNAYITEIVYGESQEVGDDTQVNFERKYFTDSEIKKISTFMLKTVKYMYVYHHPNKQNLILINAIDRNETPQDYGRRFYLLKKEKDGTYKILSKTKGVMDSWRLDPIFYFNSSKFYIISEAGCEETWGLDIYEIKENTITNMGNLDISSIDSNGYDAESIKKNLKVKVLKGNTFFEIYTDIINKRGDEYVDVKSTKNKPVVFTFNNGEFVLQDGVEITKH